MSLHNRYVELKAKTPHLFARDAAKILGVTEADLVASTPNARRLAPRFRDFVRALGELGPVKTMTRNEHAVIERWGTYSGIEVDDGPLGQVVGAEIDLRIFFNQWRAGWALEEPTPRGTRTSIQLFDHQGDSIHKIYAESEEGAQKMMALAGRFQDEGNEPLEWKPAPTDNVGGSLSPERLVEFHSAWDAMTNTHEFFTLLRKFELGRVRALELAGPERTTEVDDTALGVILDRATREDLDIMLFVGSRGMLQIQSGRVHVVKRSDDYLNVLDKGFNLHVSEKGIARTFIVRKPTNEGVVTSLELYDADGKTILLGFSKRKPGQSENPRWREWLADIPRKVLS